VEASQTYHRQAAGCWAGPITRLRAKAGTHPGRRRMPSGAPLGPLAGPGMCTDADIISPATHRQLLTPGMCNSPPLTPRLPRSPKRGRSQFSTAHPPLLAAGWFHDRDLRCGCWLRQFVQLGTRAPSPRQRLRQSSLRGRATGDDRLSRRGRDHRVEHLTSISNTSRVSDDCQARSVADWDPHDARFIHRVRGGPKKNF